MERRYPSTPLADIIVDSRRGVSHDAMARAIVEAVRAHDRARPEPPAHAGAVP